ncbi:MAG: thioredoxin family protein [Elusimicrobiota bacterium]
MKIQVVGPGCPRCRTTHQNVIDACSALQLPADVSHVTDINEFAGLGVMATPAVLVDGKIVVSGRVPAVAELKGLLKPG